MGSNRPEALLITRETRFLQAQQGEQMPKDPDTQPYATVARNGLGVAIYQGVLDSIVSDIILADGEYPWL